MKEQSLETLLNKIGSIYKLTNAAARRAKEISQGKKSLVDSGPKEKATTVAIKEIAGGKVKICRDEKE